MLTAPKSQSWLSHPTAGRCILVARTGTPRKLFAVNGLLFKTTSLFIPEVSTTGPVGAVGKGSGVATALALVSSPFGFITETELHPHTAGAPTERAGCGSTLPLTPRRLTVTRVTIPGQPRAHRPMKQLSLRCKQRGAPPGSPPMYQVTLKQEALGLPLGLVPRGHFIFSSLHRSSKQNFQEKLTDELLFNSLFQRKFYWFLPRHDSFENSEAVLL